jgi:thioredoxin reductase
MEVEMTVMPIEWSPADRKSGRLGRENPPVAVIGGGPIGLAALAHLIERGVPARLFEAGDSVGASMLDWAHVRIFSPWRYNVDQAAQRLLERHGWRLPRADYLPTGGEIFRDYLQPLALTPEMAAVIETSAKVTAVTRLGMDKVTSKGREERPFVLSVRGKDGKVRRELARAVIDASGTWTQQNPLGGSGVPAEGEKEHGDRLDYRMPDVLGRDRALYAGRRIAVVGAGYSAANVLIDLAALAKAEPKTSIVWIVRGTNLIRVYGGGLADGLPARGELGAEVKALVDSGRLTLVTGFSTTAVRGVGEDLVLEGETADGLRQSAPFDRVVVATGQRPDLDLTRELRLDLDPWLESAKALGPLIDPNMHSCGSVPPHGHRELSHPEPGFYTVGVKSYGRAPTFLLLTGYEQVRSVVAAIAGDLAAADASELVLPETGVCSTQSVDFEVGSSGGCCGGPAPEKSNACCQADAVAKAAGEDGCGCGVEAPPQEVAKVACCGAAA